MGFAFVEHLRNWDCCVQSSSQSDGALQLVALKKAPSEGAPLGKAVLDKEAKAQKNEVSILIEAGQGEGMAGEGQHLHRKSPEAGSLDSGFLRYCLGKGSEERAML